MEAPSAKNILFYTTDGKPTSIGDEYWYVKKIACWNKLYRITICSVHDIGKGIVQFSTKALAEEYIKEYQCGKEIKS